MRVNSLGYSPLVTHIMFQKKCLKWTDLYVMRISVIFAGEGGFMV